MNYGRCMSVRIKNICTGHYTGWDERPRFFINHTGCSLIELGDFYALFYALSVFDGGPDLGH